MPVKEVKKTFRDFSVEDMPFKPHGMGAAPEQFRRLGNIDTSVTVGSFGCYNVIVDTDEVPKFSDADIRLAIAEYETNLEKAIVDVAKKVAALKTLLPK